MKSGSDTSFEKQLTRREVIQLAGGAAAGVSLLGLSGCEQNQKKPQKGMVLKDAWCAQNQSVFCKTCGPNDPKKGYDSPPAYGLFAFWLMLTTQDWDGCLKDEEWRRQLAGEFDITWNNLSTLYDAAHDTTSRTSGSFTYTNLQLFSHLRDVWQKFAAKWASVPAGTFYPGGRFLLQIARQFPQTLPAQPFLPETCKGTAVTASVAYGPVALWLMLTTENWGECLRDDTWRAGVAREFKIAPGALDELYALTMNKGKLSDDLNFSNETAFSNVQAIFFAFLRGLDFGQYGGHPCSSPRTLLQIAAGGR